MSRRTSTKKKPGLPPSAIRRGLFINSPYDDNSEIRKRNQLNPISNINNDNIKYTDVSNTIGNIGITSPSDLGKLKSPTSSLISPIRLYENNVFDKKNILDRPLSPRIASPRIASPRIVSPRIASSEIASLSSGIASPSSGIASSEIASPSPRIASPRIASPRIASPRPSPSPRIASPRIASPRIASPRRETSKQETSSTRWETPEQETSERENQRIMSPRIASPRYIKNVSNSNRNLISNKDETRSLISPLHSLNKKHPLPFLSPQSHPVRSSFPFREPEKRSINTSTSPAKLIYSSKIRSGNNNSFKLEDNITHSIDNTIIIPVKNNNRKSSSPKIINRSNIIVEDDDTSIPPYEEEFIANIGDELTRNGITYIFQQSGWKPASLYPDNTNDTENVEIPKEKKVLSSTDKFMKNIPDYSLLTSVQQVYIRSRFNIKFDMIRETWPQYSIPYFDDDTPLENIHIIYNHYVKHIYARESAQSYMLYVIAGWLCMEIVAVKILGLPAGKFTEFKMNRMGKYKMLLIQLGEKYQGSYGEGWPVEIKILVMSLVEMILFIVVRWLLGNANEAGVETSVDTISNLIDRYFGITGIPNSGGNSNIPPPPEFDIPNDDDLRSVPKVIIPSLPEESNDVANLTSWIPTITNTLGLNSNSATSTKTNDSYSSNAADKVRARAANRKRTGNPSNSNSSYNPPFDS